MDIHILSAMLIFYLSLHKNINYKGNSMLFWKCGKFELQVYFFIVRNLSRKNNFIYIYFNHHFNKYTGFKVIPISFPSV